MELYDILRHISVGLEDVERRQRVELGLMIHRRRHLQVEKGEMRAATAQDSILFDVDARDPFADRRAGAGGMFVRF